MAASSFGMEVTDPRELLELMDREKFELLVEQVKTRGENVKLEISEPAPELGTSVMMDTFGGVDPAEAKTSRIITSKIQRFGENVDTLVYKTPLQVAMLTGIGTL